MTMRVSPAATSISLSLLITVKLEKYAPCLNFLLESLKALHTHEGHFTYLGRLHPQLACEVEVQRQAKHYVRSPDEMHH